VPSGIVTSTVMIPIFTTGCLSSSRMMSMAWSLSPTPAPPTPFSCVNCSYLSGLNAPFTDLSDATLTGSGLSSAHLLYATFSNDTLDHVNFKSVQLQGADLTSADLSGAMLSGTIILNATQVISADLSNTDLTNATLGGASSGASFLR